MIAKSLQQLNAALPEGVSLVAVSKFHPVERLQEAYTAGQRIFAESRPQELAAKVPLMPSDVQWHFIGHLQTNKLKLVLPYVAMVQSVDSLHLLEAISAWAVANGRVVDVLLELHLGAEETKQGFSEEEILALVLSAGKEDTPSETHGHPRPCKGEGPAAESRGRGRSEAKAVSEGVSSFPAFPGVRIRGLMGMASNTEDMERVEEEFTRIETLFHIIRAMELPDFDQLSIGMSGDWPVAVRHSATMVRIGTDIFGPREY